MKAKEMVKKVTKKTVLFSTGIAATVTGIALTQTISHAGVDYTAYKNNIMAQLNSKGSIQVEYIDENNNKSVSLIDSKDIETIADRVAYGQYFVYDVVGLDMSIGSYNNNEVVITDSDAKLTSTLSTNALNNIKLADSVTIPVYDTSGNATTNNETVASVTLKDIYSTKKHDGETFDGKGNIQDSLDTLEEIINNIEKAGWN